MKRLMHSTKHLSQFVAILLIFFALSAQKPTYAIPASLNASVDRTTIGLNETLRLTITVRGGKGNEVPSIYPRQNFEIIDQDLNIELGFDSNQKTHSIASFEYRLKPLKIGTFEIGPISTKINGVLYTANPISVTVIANNPQAIAPPQFPQDPFNPFPGFQGGGTPKPFSAPDAPTIPPLNPKPFDVTSSEEVSSNKVYVGEPFLFVYKIETNAQPIGLQEPKIKTEGFSLEPATIKPPVQKFLKEDEAYLRIEFPYKITPEKAGTLEIGPIELEATFKDLRSFNTQQKTLKNDALKIEVLPLPEPKPENFSGWLGKNFKLKSKWLESHMKNGTVQVGEAMTLEFQIAGEADLKKAWAPRFEAPGFKIYPQQPEPIQENSFIGIPIMVGWQYRFVLVPETQGEHKIPPFKFSYFDLETKKYSEVVSEAFNVSVTGEALQKSTEIKSDAKPSLEPSVETKSGLQNGWASQETNLDDRDIGISRFLKIGLIVLLISPPLVACAIFIRRRRLAWKKAHPEEIRKRQAFKKALKRLQNTKKIEDPKSKFGEIQSALRTYIGDRLNLSGESLTAQEIKNLGSKQDETQKKTIEDIADFLNMLERAIYTGTSDENFKNNSNLLDQAIDLLRKLEACA